MQLVDIKMMDNKVLEIVNMLNQIGDDPGVPKNIRNRISGIVINLNEDDGNIAVRVDRSLQELDDMSDDPNVPAYTKTQIWNIVTLLESIL